MKLDNQGFRTDFQLDVVELSMGGLIKTGYWNTTKRLNITNVIKVKQHESQNDLLKKNFVVIIALVLL